MITVHLFWLSLHSTLTQWMLTGMELKDGLTTHFAFDILFYQQHVEAFVYVCAYINMPLTIHALRIHYMYFNKCLINNLVEKHYYTQKSKKEYTSFL